jgi:hypothetical protein
MSFTNLIRSIVIKLLICRFNPSLLRTILVALPHSAITAGMAHQPPAEHPPGSIFSQLRPGKQLHTIVGQNTIKWIQTPFPAR